MKVEGVELASSTAHASASRPADGDSAASVVIIGMRGTGKTFIGELASTTLDWPFIDADAYFEQKLTVGVREFVRQHGWPAFRVAETELLHELLSEYPTKTIISLGGGIVETPAAREVLKAYAKKGPVVNIVRPINDVVSYLGEETARPQYGEPVMDVFKRREPWFAECCSYEFVNYIVADVPASSSLDLLPPRGIREEVTRFFGHITGRSPNLAPNLARGRRSYFLSLTFPDVTPALAKLEEITAGVDAIELRADLLRLPEQVDAVGPVIPPLPYVADQIAAIRQKSTLPIVFTVRTVSQGGSFPDTAVQEAFDLFNLALRVGIEYIDVEISWPDKHIKDVVARKGHSQVIASWHDWSGNMKWDTAVVKEKYDIANTFGDIVKIVGKANVLEDNFALHNFVAQVTADANAKPILAINMGVEGQLSRVLNSTFSPVTHPLLPVKAAPGQLSFTEIQRTLNLIGQLPPKKFYLFGNPIQRSMSPTLHNTAFGLLGLPHTYELLETDAVDEQVRFALASPDFGGASVTIPFKRDVMAHLDGLSPEAEAIGAVNTIIPRVNADGSTTLYGDNTDWLGMYSSVRARLPAAAHTVEAGLIIGAGGTARAAIYALHALGAKRIYLYNRTRASAEALVHAIPGATVELVDTLGAWPAEGPAPSVIISSVPAAATTTDAGAASGALLLSAGLLRAEGGVAVDMAYMPAETPLLSLVKAVGGKWQGVKGVEVLLEQGYKQFELWTGRRCPRGVVARRVWEKYNAQ